MADFVHLICPVCRKLLIKDNQRLLCASSHSFDIAGKGYVNLLLSQDKNSKDPGDNKDMALSRKHFLDKGYYEPLAKGLVNTFDKYLKIRDHGVLLDAGCGDGYYTDYLKRSSKSKALTCTIYGMDISKEAIRLAAGRNKEIRFVVASLFKLPYEDHQADFLLNAFAPASDTEFDRVLKKDGLLFTVIPGREHLIELKAVLYDNPYENDEKEPELPSFKLEDQVRIKASIEVNQHEDLMDLVTMTPYYYRTPKVGLERLNKLQRLTITTEFIISVHSKK